MAILTAEETITLSVTTWPELAAVRKASANRPSRYHLEVEAMLGTARMAFAVALWFGLNQDRVQPRVLFTGRCSANARHAEGGSFCSLQ